MVTRGSPRFPSSLAPANGRRPLFLYLPAAVLGFTRGMEQEMPWLLGDENSSFPRSKNAAPDLQNGPVALGSSERVRRLATCLQGRSADCPMHGKYKGGLGR